MLVRSDLVGLLPSLLAASHSIECCSSAPTSSGSFMPHTPHLATPKVSSPCSQSSTCLGVTPATAEASESTLRPRGGEGAVRDSRWRVGIAALGPPALAVGESSIGYTTGSWPPTWFLPAWPGLAMELAFGRGVMTSNINFRPSLMAGENMTSPPTCASASMASAWPCSLASARKVASLRAMTSRRTSNVRVSARRSRMTWSMSSNSVLAVCQWRQESVPPASATAGAEAQMDDKATGGTPLEAAAPPGESAHVAIALRLGSCSTTADAGSDPREIPTAARQNI
mmetsp:Transcript_40007/g.128308  ORF Transcript_40007/g.128308 Transcript_40007/m.128308 type:complete len:284 (+) Transcript_40007:366-1217(+)